MVKQDDKYFRHRIVISSKVTALMIGQCDDLKAEVSIILTQQQSFSSLSHSSDVSVSQKLTRYRFWIYPFVSFVTRSKHGTLFVFVMSSSFEIGITCIRTFVNESDR